MRRSMLVALALLASCTTPDGEGPPSPTLLFNGPAAVEVGVDARTVTLRRDGIALLTFPVDRLALGTVASLDDSLAYDPYWLERPDDPLNPGPPPDLLWEHVVSSTLAHADASRVELALVFEEGARASLKISFDAAGRFLAHFVPTEVPSNEAIAFMRLRAHADATEGFYGLGEWADDVNHRGKLRPMQMEADSSIESFNNEAHVPVPLLIGTRGWGLFVESRRVGLFDVARKEADLIEVTYGTAEQSSEGLRFHLIAVDHPLDVTKHYYAITGAPRLPAAWALGPWIWRDENRDQAQVLDDITKIRELDLATSGIWIDRPYASAVNTFDFNATAFPDPAAMIEFAHAQGLRMALWHTPYLAGDSEPYRSEAASAGYFPPRAGTSFNHWSDPIDFTNPDAYAWWQDRVRRYSDLGIEGFKLDYAEDVMPSLYGARNVWRFFNGEDERTMHHGYTVLYHKVYADVLPTTGGLLLCRAARWGDQTNGPVIWPGDLDATFTRHRETFTNRDGETVRGVGGLPASVIMGLGLGPSGFPFFGADTGGYRFSPPGKELYIRWFQQTALSSVMQVGDSSSQPPWELTAENGRDEETIDLYRQYARLHLRLFPYEWTYAQAILDDGRPIQRPLGLAHPELGAHPSDTYLFGDALLVAPVLVAGATSREVLLPAGRWVDWWDGTSYDGGTMVTVPAPLEKLPLLMREGAIIPMLRPTIDTLAPATDSDVDSFAADPGRLHVRMVPGASPSSFELYDGMRIDLDGRTIHLVPGSLFRSGAVLEVIGVERPSSVRRNGNAMTETTEETADGWHFESGTLWITVPDGDTDVELQ